MSLLDFRKPKCVIIQQDVSWSGKYKIFYGYHWVKGYHCYDVGAIDQSNGQITSRHYCAFDFKLNCENPQAKAAALTFWDQFKQNMKRRPTSEESEDREFRPWLN